MGFETLNEKQLRDRMRYLSDKIEGIWIHLEPKIKEFGECKSEFDQVLSELIKRGIESDETEPEV